MNKKILKKIMEKSGVVHVTPARNELQSRLIKSFDHETRWFAYGLGKRSVDALRGEASPGVLETVIDYIYPLRINKKTILNLGGGVGQMSPILRSLDFSVTNLDIEVSQVDYYNIQHDLNIPGDLPLNMNKFDIVIGQEIIEHIENPWDFFRKANTALRSDGLFIVTTPNIQSIQSKIIFFFSGNFSWFKPAFTDFHINALPLWEIEHIANKTNFELVELLGSGDYFMKQKTSRKKILRNNESLIFIFQKRQAPDKL